MDVAAKGDGAAADFVFGQSDFRRYQRGTKRPPNRHMHQKKLLKRQILARCCHRQLSVLDAFGGRQFISNLLDNVRLAANDQKYFQAIVVIKMNMEGGNDDFVMVVLDVGQGA